MLLLALLVAVTPALVEARLNPITREPPYGVKAFAGPVVDLHADSLLWGRDLLRRSSRGHVDVPRLEEAHVRLQVFGVVTKSPRGLNLTHNEATAADQITALAMVEGWPPRTFRSLRERALFQAERLRGMAEESKGRLVLLRSRADLAALPDGSVGALLALEGSHALEDDLRNVDVLYDAGFRMMAPAHFFDTGIGGSAHGAKKGGLTPLGRAWVAKLEEKRILIDLAHASPRTFDDVVRLARRPVVVSHTGVKATCDSVRNLDDDQLRAVAATGGLVGIGFWPEAVCGRDAAAIARAIRHAVDVIGVAHVALGSDFDGAVRAPFDVTGVPLIAAELRRQGLDEASIRAIFGGNALRVLGAALP